MTKMTAPLEVGLAVRDLPHMRAFYEAAIGLSFVSEIEVPGPKAAEVALSAGGYVVVRPQTEKASASSFSARTACRTPDPKGGSSWSGRAPAISPSLSTITRGCWTG